MKDLIGRLASAMRLQRHQAERTAMLFEEGSTVPFVARYRKEVTGGLDEQTLAEFRAQLNALRRLDDRQQVVLRSIEEQGKLTPELEEAIETAESLQTVEDLYLPYRPRRRTRAQAARERGLEDISLWILQQLDFDMTRDEAVAGYLSEEVPTPEDAWQGGRDIVAELVSDDAHAREIARRLTWDSGRLDVTDVSEASDPKRTYELYYQFTSGIRQLRPHQILALNRGEQAEVLRVHVAAPAERIIDKLHGLYPSAPSSPLAQDLRDAITDGYKRLIEPSIEREVRRELTEWADRHAIDVFATNLRNLLLTPPLKGETVLAIDPGFRTGCKLAILDPTGRVLDVATIFPHPPQEDYREALDILHELVAAFEVTVIAIGNGTASRETEELVAHLISEGARVRYLIVNEAGASVYSASPLARAELPDLDVSMRGAVSIGRRALDPLAELVKIDPQSIGVGMYQHDVDQKALGESLSWVTESVVNQVGVDLNTASPAILSYVSGLGPKQAERIVQFREQRGKFRRRSDLLNVPGLGEKTFTLAAGFLRISDGENPLDKTGIHPESYPAAEKLLTTLGLTAGDPAFRQAFEAKGLDYAKLEMLSVELGIGVPTLQDIVAELQRPGRDPREDVPPPILREDVLKIEDLRPGMRLTGTIRNVVDFGAFVDIGVKHDGLIHISEMADSRTESPYEILGVGDIVDVRVLTVDIERGRIGLSLKGT